MAKETVYTFKKNDQEEVRFSAGEYRDRTYFDLRIYYFDREASEMRPSKKGLTLAVEFLTELRKGLLKLENFLKNGTQNS